MLHKIVALLVADILLTACRASGSTPQKFETRFRQRRWTSILQLRHCIPWLYIPHSSEPQCSQNVGL